MKYVWIVMLGIAFGVWTILAVIDIVHVLRSFKTECAADFDELTVRWFKFVLSVIFIVSLIRFLTGE